MLVIDELKKNDPQLRLVAILLAGGLVILLVGLWWVQVVSSREYQEHLDTQAYRTIRIPAVRGKILDREGRVLAENRPRYNLSLYLDDLRKPFAVAGDRLMKQARERQKQNIAAQEKKLGRSLTKAERKQFAFTPEQVQKIREQARVQVAGEVVAEISRKMGEPLPFDAAKFSRHYATELAMPFPILQNLDAAQIAQFQENFTGGLGADLELQSMRSYPLGTTAAHVLGELRQDDSSIAGEESFFNYRLPDYAGVTGIEGKFNAALHGRAGQESVLVNNMGYRQSEDVDSQPLPGENVVTTLDLDLQRAAEESLVKRSGPRRRMRRWWSWTCATATCWRWRRRRRLIRMILHRAFRAKNTRSCRHSKPRKIARPMKITRPARFSKSSSRWRRWKTGLNANGNLSRRSRSAAAGARLHLHWQEPAQDRGHRAARPLRFQARVHSFEQCLFRQRRLDPRRHRKHHPHRQRISFGREHAPVRASGNARQFADGKTNSSGWRDGDTANVCIGQGPVDITPIQMAVMISAIANGGTVLWPRLVQRIEPQDPAAGGVTTNFPAGLVRDRLMVHQRSLQHFARRDAGRRGERRRHRHGGGGERAENRARRPARRR